MCACQSSHCLSRVGFVYVSVSRCLGVSGVWDLGSYDADHVSVDR